VTSRYRRRYQARSLLPRPAPVLRFPRCGRSTRRQAIAATACRVSPAPPALQPYPTYWSLGANQRTSWCFTDDVRGRRGAAVPGRTGRRHDRDQSSSWNELTARTVAMPAMRVVRSGCIGHSRVMQRSDWLSIVGITMSTLMSVISIALAVYVYQRDRKKGSREAEENHRRHDEVIGFLAWLCKLVGMVVEFASQLLKSGGQRRPKRPPVPRQGRTPSPTFETDYLANRNSGPQPAAQGPGRESDNISADLSFRRNITCSGPDVPLRVSPEVGVVARTVRSRDVRDEEFESPSNDRSVPPRMRIRHNRRISNPDVVASTVDAAQIQGPSI
jgi:hypothetical protein